MASALQRLLLPRLHGMARGHAAPMRRAVTAYRMCEVLKAAAATLASCDGAARGLMFDGWGRTHLDVAVQDAGGVAAPHDAQDLVDEHRHGALRQRALLLRSRLSEELSAASHQICHLL